jgi:hypothetical protein
MDRTSWNVVPRTPAYFSTEAAAATVTASICASHFAVALHEPGIVTRLPGVRILDSLVVLQVSASGMLRRRSHGRRPGWFGPGRVRCHHPI